MIILIKITLDARPLLRNKISITNLLLPEIIWFDIPYFSSQSIPDNSLGTSVLKY